MRKVKKNPRSIVVSLRLTDEEWRSLVEQAKRRSRKNISDVMREAIHLLPLEMPGALEHRP
ncbi:MAG TPA: ribbon-helix-helix protein, CopG family [Verrucomicrobiae bacterium]|nr:ribbon-helix-helix protein, CopG family [Verrucomicrobiae bacterium]